MSHRSPIFADAARQYHRCRADFDLLLEAAYHAAEIETRGSLLNARGRSAGVDSMSLFYGPEVRAIAYASDELVEWWRRHPRVTFAQFESQWIHEHRWSVGA